LEDFVVVLQVCANAGEVDENGDGEGGQLGARADAGGLEELRRVESAATENYFASFESDFGCAGGGGGRAWISTV
jgi:hypothetical protein